MNINEIFQNAVNNIKPFVDFEMVIGGENVSFRLYKTDPLRTDTIRKSATRKAIQEYNSKGYDQLPIDEDEFKFGLDRIKNEASRKLAEKNKPKNYAEQLAQQQVMYEIIKEIAIDKLYVIVDGEELLLCKDEQTKKNFVILMENEFSILNSVLYAYLELLNIETDIEDKIKNSPSEETKAKRKS